MPIVPTLERLRQEDHNGLRPARATKHNKTNKLKRKDMIKGLAEEVAQSMAERKQREKREAGDKNIPSK